jgi:hypothetical protein
VGILYLVFNYKLFSLHAGIGILRIGIFNGGSA